MRRGLWSLGLIFSLLISVFGLSTVYAYDAVDCSIVGNTANECKNITKDNKLDYQSGAAGVWKAIRQGLLIASGLAVVMVVFGGIKYTLSQGDSSALTSAKNTILYSVIGLIVALAASGIVTLVITYFVK